MIISKSTFELLQPIIDLIDGTVTIDSVVDLGQGKYQLNIRNTLWATTGFTITLGSEDYKIITLNTNVSLIVSGGSLPVKGKFQLYKPKFYHGTIKATEEDLDRKVNNDMSALDKFPLIWLHEPVDEQISTDPSEAILRHSDCKLYFLMNSNIQNWSNADHYSQAIKPIRQLIESFFDAAKKSRLINDTLLGELKIKDMPKFGNYTGMDGKSKTVFSSFPMSGTEVDVSIPFIRTEKNLC